MHKFLLLLTLGAVALSTFTGCKKDDKEDETPYLQGTMSYTHDSYVLPGTVLNLVPKGAVHPEGKDLGYIWDFSWKTHRDTTMFAGDKTSDGSISVRVPDEIGSYTISLYSYADGYYGLSTSSDLIVVSDELNTSLYNTEIRVSNPSFVDERDGVKYYYTAIDNLYWMRQNLAYTGSGVPYRMSPAMSKIFGRYYSWEEAKAACPDGWRLPTEEDWLALGKYLTNEDLESTSTWKGVAGDLMVDASFQSSKMWAYWPAVKIKNTTHFGAISAGYAVEETATTFYGTRQYATFWSAGDSDAEHAYYRYINAESPDVFTGTANKETFKATVRCVKDVK